MQKEVTTYLDLVKRWDIFLNKINARFQEALIMAKEAIMNNLVESDYDMTQTSLAWSGIKAQIQNLSDKIEQTFEEKVKPQMLQYKKEYEILEEYQKGLALSETFYSKIERFQIELEGEIGLKFYNHAIRFLNENFKCTQCGAQLQINKNIFRAQYVSCNYCNTVNTFMPNAKVSEIKWHIIDKIARYKSINEYDAMIEAQNQFNSLRMPADNEDKTEIKQVLKKREITEKAYWNKFFTERNKYFDEDTNDVKRYIENKMKYFYAEQQRILNNQ